MVKTESLRDKEIIWLCKNNSQIRRTMALANEFSQVAKEVKKFMDISDERLKVIKEYWTRNDK